MCYAQLLSGIIGYDLLFTPLHWSMHASEMTSQRKLNTSASEEEVSKTSSSSSPSASLNNSAAVTCALITNPIGLLVTRPQLSYWFGKFFGLNGMFAFVRRSANHGKHHEMRSPLQAGATVHHSLIDGGAQVCCLFIIIVITIMISTALNESVCLYAYAHVSLMHILMVHTISMFLLYLSYYDYLSNPYIFHYLSLQTYTHIHVKVLVNILVQNNMHLYVLSLPCKLLVHMGFEFEFFQWLPMLWLLSLPLLSLLQVRRTSPSSSSSSHNDNDKKKDQGSIYTTGRLFCYWSILLGLYYLGMSGQFDCAMKPRHPLSRAAHNILVTWLLCEV
jgi:hypothetical protein